MKSLDGVPLIHILNRTSDPGWVGFEGWGQKMTRLQEDYKDWVLDKAQMFRREASQLIPTSEGK